MRYKESAFTVRFPLLVLYGGSSSLPLFLTENMPGRLDVLELHEWKDTTAAGDPLFISNPAQAH